MKNHIPRSRLFYGLQSENDFSRKLQRCLTGNKTHELQTIWSENMPFFPFDLLKVCPFRVMWRVNVESLATFHSSYIFVKVTI